MSPVHIPDMPATDYRVNDLGMLVEAASGLRKIDSLSPVEPRLALGEAIKYALFENPYRMAELSRLRKSVESEYLVARRKASQAEAQGSVVNPSMMMMGAYNDTTGVLEPTRASFERLRNLCEASAPLACIISKRVEQVAAFSSRQHSHIGRSSEAGFHVRLSNPREEATPEDKRQIDILEQMIEEAGFCAPPDEEMPLGWQPGFDFFLRQGTRDLLTIDWVAVRRWESAKDPQKYPVVSFACVDAGQIRRLRREYVDVVNGLLVSQEGPHERENTKQEIVLVKVDKDSGFKLEEYSAKELVVGSRRPRTAENIFGYGYSEAEEVMDVATCWVAGLRHNALRFTNDSLPRGFFTILGHQSDSQIASFAQNWKEMLQGVGKSWKAPIFRAPAQQGAAINWTPIDLSPRDMEYSQFLFTLGLIAHCAYHIHPEETGYAASSPFKAGLSESSPQANLEYSSDTGLRPLLGWWQNFMNRHFIWHMFPSRRYKMEFTGLGDWDDMADAQMAQVRLGAGLTTPRMEWASRDIQMPRTVLDHPASDLPMPWAQGYQLLEGQKQAEQQQNMAQQQQQAAQEQPEAQPGQGGKPGAQSQPGAETETNRQSAAQSKDANPANQRQHIGVSSHGKHTDQGV